MILKDGPCGDDRTPDPAYAGMNLELAILLPTSFSIPRIRGDNPAVAITNIAN